MINVTNSFKDCITKPKMLDAKINFDDVELTAEYDINHIERIFNAGLFKTCMKGLNIDINKKISKNTIIEAKSGIYVNDKFEYVPLGKYTTHEPIRDEDTDAYRIEAYDIIEKSMIDYDLSVEYPISVRDMFIKIFERLDWDTSFIPSNFINSSKMINQDVWSGINYTFRDCLDELCTITCQWLVEKDGNPKLVQPTKTNQKINEEFFSDTNVQVKELVFFNALVFTRVEDADFIDRRNEESIKQYGLKAFKVKDNQLLSTNDRSDYIDEMWNYLKDFRYYSFDCQSNGIMFLEPIDAFSINLNNIEYETLLLEDVLDITSDISEQISAEKCEESEIELKYSSQKDKAKDMAFILLDKQNKRLEALVSEQNETSEKVTNLELNLNGIDATVKSQSTTITELQKGQQTLEKDLSTTNSNLDKTNENVSNLDKKIDGVSANFEDFKDNEYIKSIENLQDQIDGAIQFWKGNEIPTLNNKPANEWSSNEDKDNHLGDIYYHYSEDEKGQTIALNGYRFDYVDGKYQWILLSDTELAAVQALAEKAQKAADKAQETADEANNRSKENSTSITKLQENDVELKLGLDSIDERVHTTETITSDLKPTDEARGTELVLKKSAGMTLLEFEAEGNVRQKTRSGINQLMSFKKDERDFFYSITNNQNNNLFDMNWLKASDITLQDGEIIGTARNFQTNFSKDSSFIPNTNFGKRTLLITISAYVESTGTIDDTNGIYFHVNYSDGRSARIAPFKNNDTTKKTVTFTTDGTEIVNIDLTYGNNPDNMWHICDINVSDAYWYKATPLEDNWIKIECDMTGSKDGVTRYINEFIRIEKIPNIKTSTQYTIVCEFRNVNITTMQNNFNIGKTKPTEQDLIFLNAFNCNSTDIKKGLKKYLLTTCDDFGNNFIALRNFHTLSPGDKFSYECRMSVLEGDYTNKDYEYEEFGVMPSPDFPSDVETVEGYNLFNANNIKNNSIVVTDDGKDIVMPLSKIGTNGYTSTYSTFKELVPSAKVGDDLCLTFERVGATSKDNRFIYLIELKKYWYIDTTLTITQEILDSTIAIYGNQSAAGETEQITLRNFRIVKSKYKDKPFVPFGNFVGFRKTGKNLFNKENYSILSDGIGFDISNLIYGKTYTLSTNLPITDFKISTNWNGYNSVVKVSDDGFKIFTFTLKRDSHIADNKIQYVIFKVSDSVVTEISQLNDYEIQIEEGSESTSYESFIEEQLNIDFKDNFVGKLTDEIKDRLYYQNRHLYIEKQVGRITINSSSLVNITQVNSKGLAVTPPNKKQTGTNGAYSDKAKYATGSGQFKANTFYENPQNFVFVGTPDDTLETIQAKFNGGLLYYALETPEIVDLGEYDLSTFKDNNYIELLSKLETELYCKYARYTEAQEIYQTKDGMLDYYNKYETDTQILLSKNEIESHVQEMRTLVDENGQALSQVQNQVQQVTTSTNQQLNVLEERIENGVDKVVTKTGYTFDINGLSIASNLDKFKSLITNKYILVSSSDKEIAFFGYDDNLRKTIARINELESKKVKGGYHRWEGFIDENGEKRSGWFYDGGDD